MDIAEDKQSESNSAVLPTNTTKILPSKEAVGTILPTNVAILPSTSGISTGSDVHQHQHAVQCSDGGSDQSVLVGAKFSDLNTSHLGSSNKEKEKEVHEKKLSLLETETVSGKLLPKNIGEPGDVPEDKVTEERAREIQDKYAEELLDKYDNVTGVGVSYRRKDGVVREGEFCLQVWVKRKLPESQVAPEQLLPKHLENVPVDVVEGEAFYVMDNSRSASDKNRRESQKGTGKPRKQDNEDT